MHADMTPEEKMAEAERLYQQAFELASEALEESAMALMKAHPKIKMFGASMGTASFYGPKSSICPEWEHGTGRRAELAVQDWHDTFCARFDCMFDNAYRPVRIKRDGAIEHDW